MTLGDRVGRLRVSKTVPSRGRIRGDAAGGCEAVVANRVAAAVTGNGRGADWNVSVCHPLRDDGGWLPQLSGRRMAVSTCHPRSRFAAVSNRMSRRQRCLRRGPRIGPTWLSRPDRRSAKTGGLRGEAPLGSDGASDHERETQMRAARTPVGICFHHSKGMARARTITQSRDSGAC